MKQVMNRKAYQTPKLSRYEDIRTLTLGGSPIGSESIGPGGIDFRIAGGITTQGNVERTTTDEFEG